MDETAERVDPLTALRETDHRSSAERIRERLRTRQRKSSAPSVASSPLSLAGAPHLAEQPSPVLRTLPLMVVVLALAAAYALPRLSASSGVAVEDSLPLAKSSTIVTASTAVTTAPATQVEVQESTRVVVHVAGSVIDPGLVLGDSTWRVADAIDAAGGVSADADLDRVNLAAFVTDATRIYVPSVDELSVPCLLYTSDAADE